LSKSKLCAGERWSFWVVILREKNFQVGSFGQRLWRHYREGDTLKVTLYKQQERILNGLYTVTRVDKNNHLVIARRRRTQPHEDR